MTTLPIDRRSLFRAGAVGLAALSVPAFAAESGFTHGIASGEPGPHRVLLWTRYVGSGDTRLGWEISDSESFGKIIASGEAVASPDKDWCVKAWAEGLAVGKWYFYRFVAQNGAVSPVGRTRTLPLGKVPSFKLAVFTCSNFGFGWFNAYAHACEAGDFDLSVHLGDYFYEYKRGEYPSTKAALAERPLPLEEAVTLAGYRERYATYRADPDLQRLHAGAPMVAMWDDHETANDTWKLGAENHDSATEGDWAVRKAASERAWREWMPVSDDYWASYEIGNLATLFRLETRHLARDEQLDLVGALKGQMPADVPGVLARFRERQWRDPKRTLMGAEQERWLAAQLKASTRARKPWQVLAQQVVMGQLLMPDIATAALPEKTSPAFRDRLLALVGAAHAGIPYNMDAWDGYPAARTRLCMSALAANANLLVLSGDSHNAWGFEHTLGKSRVGAEFGVQSVTSPGSEGSLGWIKSADLQRATLERNPNLKWCDTAQRGYLALELTPSAASGEWRFMQTVRQKGTALASSKRMTVLAGQRQFTRS
jgi:alkaline phosphatase D